MERLSGQWHCTETLLTHGGTFIYEFLVAQQPSADGSFGVTGIAHLFDLPALHLPLPSVATPTCLSASASTSASVTASVSASHRSAHPLHYSIGIITVLPRLRLAHNRLTVVVCHRTAGAINTTHSAAAITTTHSAATIATGSGKVSSNEHWTNAVRA